jgi:hypothetical protein
MGSIDYHSTVEGVTPVRRHLRTGSDGDDNIRYRLLVGVDTAVADDIVGVNVLNRLNRTKI